MIEIETEDEKVHQIDNEKKIMMMLKTITILNGTELINVLQTTRLLHNLFCFYLQVLIPQLVLLFLLHII